MNEWMNEWNNVVYRGKRGSHIAAIHVVPGGINRLISRVNYGGMF